MRKRWNASLWKRKVKPTETMGEYIQRQLQEHGSTVRCRRTVEEQTLYDAMSQPKPNWDNQYVVDKRWPR